MVRSGAIFTAEIFPSVRALSLRLNLKVNTDFPIISSMILFPTDSKSCTFTSGPATVPLTMFLRVGSDVKGEQASSF